VLVDDSTIKQSFFTMPLNYTAGLSLVYKNALTLSADYGAQHWGDVQYKGLGYSLANSNRIAGGLQYTKLAKYYNYEYEKYYLQAGAYYSNNYLVVNGYQLRSGGFTMGIGASTKRGLGYQFNLQVGQRGTTANSLLKEQYTQCSVSLFYREFWRTKAKIYD